MNLELNRSFWICNLFIFNLILNCQLIRAQDTITVLDQSDEAQLVVSENYTFTLNTDLVDFSTVVWSVSGADVFDISDFEITGSLGRKVTIQFSSHLINPRNIDKNPENIYFVKAAYGTPERQSILKVTLHNNGKLFLTEPRLSVSTDIGFPILNTNKDATVVIEPGDQITFTAKLPFSKTSSDIVWAAPGPNTFGGSVVLDPKTPDKLIYTATNFDNPTLATGTDVISVTDGISVIVITIFVKSGINESLDCDRTKSLMAVPGKDGFITVDPLTSVTLTASGGTCDFLWTLITNNSEGATLTKTDRVHAIYTAGNFVNTVDTIELSDGVSVIQIEMHVSNSKSRSSGGGCFLRNRANYRD